jgi:hypothetical protein
VYASNSGFVFFVPNFKEEKEFLFTLKKYNKQSGGTKGKIAMCGRLMHSINNIELLILKYLIIL